MRVSTFALLATAAAIPATQAAPLKITDVIHQVISNTATTLQGILSGLGIQVSTNAAKHGPNFGFNCNVQRVEKALQAHQINWFAQSSFPGWKNYKANGVNLGGWFELEAGNDPNIFNNLGCPGAPDEWTCSGQIGKAALGPQLDARYASFVTTADIDLLKQYGVNTLRIPTTYAAWIDLPQSQLYHGSQQRYLKTVTDYAVQQGMHVIIGLHSLPGGTNNLDIGEALNHDGWWYNATNMASSLTIVDNVITFIKNSANPRQFTLAPANEVGDNGLQNFGSPQTISSPDGVNYYNTYLKAVYAKLQKSASYVPMMIQDSFMGASYWAPFWNTGDNIVFDSHFYFFAAGGIYGGSTGGIIPVVTCGQASAAATSFPVFVGEWSLESLYNNSLEGRQTIYQSQLYAYQKYLSGGSFWSYNSVVDTTHVPDGNGTQRDYWNFQQLITDKVVLPGGAINASYC